MTARGLLEILPWVCHIFVKNYIPIGAQRREG